MQWHRFDYDNKNATAPPIGELVWVHDVVYQCVATGYYDGFTMFVCPEDSDDCSVSHWMEMSRPEPPSSECSRGDH